MLILYGAKNVLESVHLWKTLALWGLIYESNYLDKAYASRQKKITTIQGVIEEIAACTRQQTKMMDSSCWKKRKSITKSLFMILY